MKKMLLLLALVCNISFAQTVIKCEISELPKTKYVLKIAPSSLNEYKGIIIDEGVTDDLGQFKSTIELNDEQPIYLYIGNLFFSLWINPEASFSIKKNSDGAYTFLGSVSTENTILYKSRLMQPYLVQKNVGLKKFDLYKQLSYLDSIEEHRLDILNSNFNDDVSEKFKSYYKAEVHHFTLNNKNQYINLIKGTGNLSDKDIPLDYYDFWKGFKLENDSVSSNIYQSSLLNFIEYKSLIKVGKENIGSVQAWEEMFRFADSLLIEKPLTLQKQKTEYLFLLIKYFNFDLLVSSELESYRNQFPQSSSLPILENIWNKKKRTAFAMPSFHLKDSKGHMVDIKDFRGKVIYIDFWGSWCKACLINMPHSAKLKEKLKNMDVIFLYINFYDTNEKWTNAIKKYHIEGVHLKAEKSDEAYFNDLFEMGQGFPRYALIDKEGKLVTSSAPQPQDESAFGLIQEYLRE